MLNNTKRLILFLFAFTALIHAVPAHAVWPWDDAANNNTVRYRLSVAAHTSTAAVVVDLSSTTVWPHKQTKSLNISSVRLELDKAAASTATVKLGVVNYVDPSTGSVTWFYNKSHELNVSNTDVRDFINYAPNYVPLLVTGNGPQTDGSTPYILSNDITSGSAVYKSTNSVLPSVIAAGVKPAPGDLVMSVGTGAGTVVVNLTVQYFSSK